MTPLCVGFRDVLTLQELAALRDLSEVIPHQPGGVDLADPTYRSSCVAWMNSESAWYGRFQELFQDINAGFFHFDIAGMERLQFARYVEGDHFGWHIDARASGPCRKLALVLCLTRADHYKGGEFEFMQGATVTSRKLEAGELIALPAFTLHRVAKITGGTRRTLVAWATGPEFR